MTFDILTIFPRLFDGFCDQALIARAIKKKIIRLSPHNLRDWTHDAHRTVDGRPYGGGAGMVLMVEPIVHAVQELKKRHRSRVIVFSAKGKLFTQADARRLTRYEQLILICGRYEGIDERVAGFVADEEVSIGEYVLFGGEVPAMVVIEAVTRLLPGSIGKQKSLADESFGDAKGLAHQQLVAFVEYPHYTRPEKIKLGGKTRAVPKVLLSGNHAKIDAWRRQQSVRLTRRRRPELK